MTIGKIDLKNNLIYIDTAFSGEKSFFIETTLEPGEYVVLIEVYWNYKNLTELVFGSYSNYILELDILP